MPQFDIAATLISIVQTIASAVVALVLLGFYRQYRKSYLLHWTLGWSALAINNLFSGIWAWLALGLKVPATEPVEIIVAVIVGVTGYLQIGWLLFGVYELVRRRPVRIAEARRIIWTLFAVGLILSLLFISPTAASSVRYLVRIGIRALAAAIGFGVASFILWRVRGRRVGIGFTVLGAAFALYALEQIHYVVLALMWQIAGRMFQYAIYIGYVDFLLQSVMAVGMIACVLEDEREAAELAAVEMEDLADH